METIVRGRYMEVAVLVNGQRQPIYRRQRDNQPFVEGLWGQPYVLEVRNLTHARVEILNSVDGRNTLRDEEADLRLNRGIIIGPHDVWTITGWRIDDNNTGQFVFSDPTQSVEQMATGTHRNAGVFGFALYAEYVQPVYRGDVYRGGGTMRGGGQFLGVSKGGQESFSPDMGTRMGDIQHDAVGRTTFNRASSEPVEVLTIHYRSRDWLERYGIIVPDEPQAFPGSQTGYSKYR